MPIGELTDEGAAYPRGGTLRKGGPKKKVYSKRLKKDVWVVGDDLDHFRFVTDDQTALRVFEEVYGSEPREINVFLPYATKDENFDAWMKEYGAGSLKRKCSRPKDRKNGVVVWQDNNGQFQTIPQDCQWPNCECVPRGNLYVIIPELIPVMGVKLVWVLTGAWNDCAELSKNIAAAERSARGLGRDLRGIPFVLTRRLDSVSTPPRDGSNKKRVRDEKWMLHIEPNKDWVADQIEAYKQLASPLNGIKVLPVPDVGLDEVDELFTADIEQPETEVVLDEESESEPETKGQGNGIWPTRPWEAETTRAALNKALETIEPDGRKTFDSYRKKALATLNKLTLGNDDARHKLTWYLFGEESTKDLTVEHFAVITDKWTKVAPPDFEPDPNAVTETRSILEALGFEPEQVTMELEAEA